MKIKLLFALPILALALLLSACDNTLDINAPWKDITVTYGLLNQADSVHYIKVGKAFLGEENAYMLAQEFDSLYYGDNIEVTLKELATGTIYTMERVLDNSKPDGVFHSPAQILYKKAFTVNPNSRYELRIVKGNDLDHVVAQTVIVDDFVIDNPKQNSKVALTSPTFPYKVQFKSAKDGTLYQMTIRINYMELNKFNPADSTLKYLDWVFQERTSRNDEGGESMNYDLVYPGIYTFMASRIPVDENVTRHLRGLDFFFSVAAEEFQIYQEVNRPSNSIVQERPLYTNIENGLGLFSARYNKNLFDIDVTDFTIDSIACGQYTRGLNFGYYRALPSSNQIDTLYCN
jgi:hypothetical protein